MQKTTFWNLISSADIRKISIPTIQRDYALGRRDKAINRSSFLKALKKAVGTGEPLLLDFIYGVDSGTMFVPLDGQQRLTTLWLLHWFTAYKAGKLNDADVKDNLQKFTYETRATSTDFCKSLCSLAPMPKGGDTRDSKTSSIRAWITQQTWFYHQYKQDPTITGMLNTIAGTGTKDKTCGDMADGLEELFPDKEYDFASLWHKLTTEPCIVFQKLEVGLQDSDELYVKMNARGKQLTDFENFKTELVHYAQNADMLGENAALRFAAKLDVEWTDIFWENRWEDPKTEDVSIDEIYFTFIRRYARLEYIKKHGDDKQKPRPTDIFARTFTEFAPYKEALDRTSIENLITIMDNLRGHELEAAAPWGDTFCFVPQYTSDKKQDVSTITYDHLLIFYGYCAYLLHGSYEEASFTEWNRVLWNICTNRADKSTLLPTISEIDILAPHSHDITSYLSQEEAIECQYNKEQLQEEQRKARKLAICRDTITEMESYAFFKGAIRFLFTGPDGNEDWDDFETKARNIKELIPTGRADRHTIKLLVPYIPEQELCTLFYNWTSNNDEDLRYLLLQKEAAPFLHNFLLQNDGKAQPSQLHKDIMEICEKAFGGKGYLQTRWKDDGRYIWTNYETRRGYYAWCSFVIGSEAHYAVSRIIGESAMFTIHDGLQRMKVGNYIPSCYIHFKYRQHFLTLYGNDTVCLMTDQWEDKRSNPNDANGYYFAIGDITTEAELVERIEATLQKTAVAR